MATTNVRAIIKRRSSRRYKTQVENAFYRLTESANDSNRLEDQIPEHYITVVNIITEMVTNLMRVLYKDLVRTLMKKQLDWISK